MTLSGYIIEWFFHGLVATELHLHSSASGQKKNKLVKIIKLSGIYYAGHVPVQERLFHYVKTFCYVYISVLFKLISYTQW